MEDGEVPRYLTCGVIAGPHRPVAVRPDEPLRGQVPFGYREQDGGLVADDAEQDAIALMARMRSAGQSLREIVGELNQQKIAAKNGGRWQPNTIAKILARS